MNVIKIQQELLAELPGAYQEPHFYARDKVTMLINSVGSVLYLIPDDCLYLDMRHFHALERIPFREYATGEWTELSDTHMAVGEGKKTLKVFKRGEQSVYIDKNLLKHFEKGAKLYQEKDRAPIAVTEQGLVVAYVMPCNPPKETK